MKKQSLESSLRKVAALTVAVLGLGVPAFAAAPAALTGFPFTDENLTYSIAWPTGLGLGEAHLLSGKTATSWSFELAINASLPGFEVRDTYNSRANADFCSSE
ncbi:MAG: hypothetical protein ABUS49_07505, partial [Acidobacteriota bacterium]